MKRKKQSPLWPYLGILTCLFVLSVTAPRAWERMGRKQALDLSHKSTARRSAETVALLPSQLEPVVEDELTARTAVNSALLESQPASPAPEPPAIEATPAIEAPAVEPSVIEQTAPESPASTAAQPTIEGPLPAPLPWPIFGQLAPAAPEFASQSREQMDLANIPRELRDGPDTTPPADEGPTTERVNELEAAAWPLPRTLLEQLAELTEAYPSAAWAEQATMLIKNLCTPETEPSQAHQILQQLSDLCEHNQAAPTTSAALESMYTRTRYALVRWVDVWQRAVALEAQAPQRLATQPSTEQIKVCLADIAQLTSKHQRGSAWREFLQLESLQKLSGESSPDDQRRAQARRVLDRLSSSRLSPSQRKFVNDGPLANLQTQLRAWAAEPVAAQRMLKNLERYEATALASDARLVANDLRGLNWSPDDAAEDAGETLQTHYRNANFRVALAAPLVNRMVPQPEPVNAPVRDTVLNVPVYGRSTTWTDLSVRLVPDATRIRIGLEAEGLVNSDTRATSGPATFHNEGRSTFLVRKLMVLGPRGLVVWPAVAEAENNFSYLISLETDFDGVPLVGPLVRTIARNQHDDSLDEARYETQQKVAMRARYQLDAEVKPRLEKAAETIQKKQLATLKRLGLEVEPVALSTTEQRVVARLRLASHEQLGAHTPRPRAPSDSWLSLQLHQSAMNNTIEGLDLNGRKFTLPELFAWVAEKFDQPKLAQLDDIPDDVSVTFAPQDAVRLRCENGGVEVTFAIARLTRGKKTWRNFTVRSVYRPEAQGLEPRFVRDDTIHLDGSLRGKIEPGVRAIFSRVLSKNRDLRLLDEKTTSDPRMKDLCISQFVSEDGWLGLAYSPKRGAKVARQPQR